MDKRKTFINFLPPLEIRVNEKKDSADFFDFFTNPAQDLSSYLKIPY